MFWHPRRGGAEFVGSCRISSVKVASRRACRQWVPIRFNTAAQIVVVHTSRPRVVYLLNTMLFIAVDYRMSCYCCHSVFMYPRPIFFISNYLSSCNNTHSIILCIIQGGSFDENGRDAYYNDIMLNIIYFLVFGRFKISEAYRSYRLSYRSGDERLRRRRTFQTRRGKDVLRWSLQFSNRKKTVYLRLVHTPCRTVRSMYTLNY